MDIVETRHDNALVVTPTGRLDSASAASFDARLAAAIDRGDHDLVVDLAGLDYIGSTGLSALLSAAKKLRAAGGRIALSGMNNRVRLVFEMSGFLRLFPIYATLDEALQAR